MSHKSNYKSDARFAWSYQTVIRQTLANGMTIGNTTKYSRTTSRHQTKERIHSCNILIDRVPIGTSDLAYHALKRGLLHSLEFEVEKAAREKIYAHQS